MMNGRGLSRVVAAGVAALSIAFSAEAGVFYLSFDQHFTGNLFRTAEAVADRVSGFSLSLDSGGPGLSWACDLSYARFHENTGLSFFSGGLGFDYLKPSGRRSAWQLALNASGSLFGGEYAAFSSLGLDLDAAFKTYVSPSSILNLRWQGRGRAFRDPLFDYLNQVLALSLDKYLRTGTTLKAGAGFGYKYFLHPFLPSIEEPPPGQPAGSMGYRGGHGFLPRYSAAGGGAGLGYLSASGSIAQALGDRAGLAASFEQRWTLTGGSPFQSVEEFYYVANPSLDDFSWEGRQAGGQLTLEIAWDIEMKMNYTFLDRNFPGVESMALDGTSLGTTRGDRRHLVGVRVERAFRRFAVYLGAGHVDNRSTDPHFVWKSSYFQAGLEWNAPFGRKE
jgi:hypothetical protein